MYVAAEMVGAIVGAMDCAEAGFTGTTPSVVVTLGSFAVVGEGGEVLGLLPGVVVRTIATTITPMIVKIVPNAIPYRLAKVRDRLPSIVIKGHEEPISTMAVFNTFERDSPPNLGADEFENIAKGN